MFIEVNKKVVIIMFNIRYTEAHLHPSIEN